MLKSILILPLILAPAIAMAETAQRSSSISQITVYGEGATFIRDVDLDLSAGQHKILINLPDGGISETLRVLEETGLVVNTISIDDIHANSQTRSNPARDAIKAKIDQLDRKVREMQADRAEIGLIVTAANTRIAMLRAIGTQQAGAAATPQGLSGADLSDLVALVGSETLNALQDAQSAQRDMTEIDLELVDLAKQRKELEADLNEAASWILLSIDLTVTPDFDGQFQLKYLSGYAAWRPSYELHLNNETGALMIDRQVVLQQETGETWENAEIMVSTSQPSGSLSFGQLSGRKASYFTPQPVELLESSALVRELAYAAPEVVMMEQSAAMGGRGFQTNGLNASFTIPAGAVVSGNWEETVISVDQMDFETEITARAATYSTQTAYLFATFTNDSDLPYLPGPAVFYRDGGYVGQHYEMPSIAVGESSDLGFGIIEGLMVERRILNRETGEAGVLTTRNDSVDEYEITVENLTPFDWDMIIYDRVLYSEQEDLEIDFSARPQPSEVNVDGERGVLAWEFPLAAGATNRILFAFEMEWPEGTELRR